MLHFKKLMLNSTKIEDVVEVRIELGKTFVREKFVFLGDSFFSVQPKEWMGWRAWQLLYIFSFTQLNLSRDSKENRME